MTDDTFLQRIRDTFKNKRVLIMGDSIMRGLYKDLCCILSNNGRLLYNNELTHNRHNVRVHPLFGENIDLLQFNRTNSTLNKEKRIFQSVDFSYYVVYVFISRVWNYDVEALIPSVNQEFDVVILNSFIWDITRYNDDGDIYLKNLDKCFSHLQESNKQILWINFPSSKSNKATYINNILIKLSPLIVQQVEQHSIYLINLSDSINDNQYRHNDGVHFTPAGYREVTQMVVASMSNLPNLTSSITTNALPTTHATTSSSEINPSINVTPYANNTYSNFNRNKFVKPRVKPNSYAHDDNNNNQIAKRIKPEQYEAEKFAIGFGIAYSMAWKTYQSFK